MNDMPSPQGRIWARKGEQIVCVREQHPICALSRDISVGEGRSEDDFTDWQQPQPDRKTSIGDIRCVKCRSPWLRGSQRHGYQFHFVNGWR